MYAAPVAVWNMTSKDCWDYLVIAVQLASAIAAAAAVLVALRVAFSQRKEREEQELRRAILVTSGVAVQIEAIRVEVETAFNSLQVAMSKPELSIEMLNQVNSNLGRVDLEFLTETELQALAWLPEGGGEAIYAGLACVRTVKSTLRRRIKTARNASSDGRHSLVEYWFNLLGHGHERLFRGLQVCSKHGSEGLIAMPEKSPLEDA